ncbi:alpha/beta fold hydrolase [Microbacterium sp. CH12i]|uniref:alpha/beta fold hydrolase n=1 Tax=Microbacterium sp. CH12i TaxID=1479651 RepID=UPI00068923AE|nr:alpha/beta hydrolase [Microbacterium sp. CH12i]
MIPGQGLDITYLGLLAHSVAQEDFRIVRIGSRWADTAASLNDLAQNVVDVMDHLAVTNAWVGGHAFGGSVARTVALDHHDRVNGVLLLGVEESALVPGALAAGIPVLVIQGTHDEITPAVNGEKLQAAAPGLVSVVPIEGAGHMFPETHMGATSWAIEDYLDWD